MSIIALFSESKELIAGYWPWQVRSRDEAIEWLKRAPFADMDEAIDWVRRYPFAHARPEVEIHPVAG
ncbi:YCII-related domain protein [Variovorax sp. PBL-H6]|nr:YCII-related domain protein [Variovorax sp. PBL-H6]